MIIDPLKLSVHFATADRLTFLVPSQLAQRESLPRTFDQRRGRAHYLVGHQPPINVIGIKNLDQCSRDRLLTCKFGLATLGESIDALIIIVGPAQLFIRMPLDLKRCFERRIVSRIQHFF